MKEENNYTLFLWIKKQQEEEEAHQLNMAITRKKDDNSFYLDFLKKVVMSKKCNNKELMIIANLVRWNKDGRLFSDAQRSLIANMYSKYVLC